MGKNKVRIKKNSKGERWAKGQSSNSNPSKTKHRVAAKSRFFNHGSTDGSKLTTAALLRHDATFGLGTKLTSADIEAGGGEVDVTDMTHKTFDTFASDWSGCTNVAFEKVLQKFKASRSGDKEMLAVLAAVTEVIRAEGGKETETEYFAALMTTLDVTTDELHLSAVLRLLSVVIKKVPHPVLISKFSQINASFMNKLSVVTESANVSVMRALLGCISVLLRVQPGSVWSLAETRRSLTTLLSFTCHTKPKIRKSAQHSVVSVVRGSDPDLVPPHPSAVTVAQFWSDRVSSSGPGQDNTVLYMLTMIKEILPVLPKSAIKSSCEMILKLLTLGTPILVTTCFSTLHAMFSGRPSVSGLTVEMNGQLLTALADFRPGVHDTGPMVAWLATMQEGLINLGLNSMNHVQPHLVAYCRNILDCWTSDRAEVVKAGGVAVGAVLGELGRDIGTGGNFAANIVQTLSQGLKYNYNRGWQTVLSVLGIMVQVLGEKNPDCMKSMLQSLSQMRASENFGFEAELDLVIGKAVSVIGPRKLLEAIPLNITGEETDYEFKSSWLLPIFRENIKNTELAFFIEYFLPLAAKCLSRSVASGDAGDNVGQKTYEVLVYQIWSLLPGFCNCPTDLSGSFKNIARILGVQLGQRKEIRLDILSSLRQLISRNLENDVNKAELARYSKNFLPILFNLYTSVPQGSEEAGQRLAALETIKLFLQISDRDLLGSMFDRALDKFSSETAQFTKDAIIDLLRCMMPHINEERLSVLYKEIVPRLSSKDHKEQKKAYRVLEELCKCSSDESKKFISSSLSSLQVQLLASLSSASPSSQAPRLRCLLHLISGLEEPHPDFVLSVIPEAVLSIKAVNGRARAAAFSLLIVVGEALQRWSQDQDSDGVVRKFMGAVLAGLAGSPNMIHCTILAISRIYFTFREQFPEDLADQVLNNILVLLGSSSREVSGASLSFVKVIITTTPIISCTKYVPNIVKALVEMSDDCKRHFRLKTKFLYERLVRKFGWDFVSSLVPKSDETTHKRLKNMRKDLARRARKHSEDSGNDDEDFGVSKRHKTIDEILADSSDEDDLFDEEVTSKKGKDKRSKKKTQTWIHEGSEGIVDLLSSSAAQAVSSTNPNTPKSIAEKSKSSGAFKINSDGKFVITENSDDENEDKGPKKRSINFDDLDSDSDEETFEDLVSTKKRKMNSEAGSMKSTKTSASGRSAFSKYTTGGSGIHRDTSRDAGSEYRNKSGRGDVKKIGKHDPYAYIPLNHKNLNKRKSAKNKGQFKNVITAARKGAAKGKKNQVKDVKKLMKNMNI